MNFDEIFSRIRQLKQEGNNAEALTLLLQAEEAAGSPERLNGLAMDWSKRVAQQPPTPAPTPVLSETARRQAEQFQRVLPTVPEPVGPYQMEQRLPSLEEVNPFELRTVVEKIKELKREGKTEDARDLYYFTARAYGDPGLSEFAPMVDALAGEQLMSPEELEITTGEEITEAIREGGARAYREIGRGIERMAAGGSPITTLQGLPTMYAPRPEEREEVAARQEEERREEQARMPEPARRAPFTQDVAASLATLPLYTGIPGGPALGRGLTRLGQRIAPGMPAARIPSFAAPQAARYQYPMAAAEGALREDIAGGGATGAVWNVLGQGVGDIVGRSFGRAMTPRGFEDTSETWARDVQRGEAAGVRFPPGYKIGNEKIMMKDAAIYKNAAYRDIPNEAYITPNRLLANRKAAELAGIPVPPDGNITFSPDRLSQHVRNLEREKDALIAQGRPVMAEADFNDLTDFMDDFAEDFPQGFVNTLHAELRNHVGMTGQNPSFRPPKERYLREFRDKLKRRIDSTKNSRLRSHGRQYLNVYDDIYENELARQVNQAAVDRLRLLRTHQYWTLNLMEEGMLTRPRGDVNTKQMWRKFYQPTGRANVYDAKMIERANLLSPQASDVFDLVSGIEDTIVRGSPPLSSTQRLGNLMNPEKGEVESYGTWTRDPVREYRRWGIPGMEDIREAGLAAHTRYGYPSITGWWNAPFMPPGVQLRPEDAAVIQAAVRNLGRAGGQTTAAQAERVKDAFTENVVYPIRGTIYEAFFDPHREKVMEPLRYAGRTIYDFAKGLFD